MLPMDTVENAVAEVKRVGKHPGIRAVLVPVYPADEKEWRAWLKTEHGLGTNTAWWLAERASGEAMGMADDDPESYLANSPSWRPTLPSHQPGTFKIRDLLVLAR